MSKFTLVAALVLLGGCSTEKQQGPFRGGGGMDAPILVSDDLHVRHAHNTKKGKVDFLISSSGSITAFSDSNLPVKSIVCEQMKVVHLSPSTASDVDCTQSGGYTANADVWQVDIYPNPGGSGTSLLTLNPSAASPPCIGGATNCVVVALDGNVTGPTEDDGSDSTTADSETTGGTDMAIYNPTGNTLTFASAVLTDQTTMHSAILNCKNPNPQKGTQHDCKIRLKFK